MTTYYSDVALKGEGLSVEVFDLEYMPRFLSSEYSFTIKDESRDGILATIDLLEGLDEVSIVSKEDGETVVEAFKYKQVGAYNLIYDSEDGFSIVVTLEV